MLKMDLHNKSSSTTFYDEKYSNGYMKDFWPVEKKQRIVEVIRELDLPETGEALDFGCGNGALTNIIKQALPKWQIYGADLSEVAIGIARDNFTNCTFFVSTDKEFCDKQFDFLFSHHVLEHVYDLAEVLDQINSFLKPTSHVLHILPCGNAGSFEHNMCTHKENGIDNDREGRFYFEAAGHLRRLSTGELNSLLSGYNLELKQSYYNYHYHGAIDWITRSGKNFILKFTSYDNAINNAAAQQLRAIRKKLMLVYRFRGLAGHFEKPVITTATDYFWALLLLSAYPFRKIIDKYYRHKAKNEWQKNRDNPHGSEMYLFYTRKKTR
jgi:trans-aconitate methyltransferase